MKWKWFTQRRKVAKERKKIRMFARRRGDAEVLEIWDAAV
jgi:hypothetical protein